MILRFIENLLASGVKLAAPLWLTATGETYAERAGVINIGLEGMMLAGAFAGMAVSYFTANPWLGLLAGMLAAVVLAALFGVLTIYFYADQIITGAALNLVALGLTGFFFRSLFGVTGAALTVTSFPLIAIPVLDEAPFFGAFLSGQPVLLYLALGVIPLASFVLNHTALGLAIRACGEYPAAVDTAGRNVFRLRLGCMLFCGMLTGAAGAYLTLAHANTFVEGITAGRGFIALAIVIFGRWQPLGVFFASLFFGCANALQFQFQARGYDLPYQFFLMLPYLLTLLVLVFSQRGSQGPAALGKAYHRG